jgi:hypothetical protein
MRGGNRPQPGPNEYSANGPGAGVGRGGDHERGQQHAGYPPARHHYPGGQQPGQGQRGQEQVQQGQPASGGGQAASSQPSQQQQGHEAGQQAQQNQNVPWGGPFPSLHLWPLNETFVMKMIHLPQGERVSHTLASFSPHRSFASAQLMSVPDIYRSRLVDRPMPRLSQGSETDTLTRKSCHGCTLKYGNMTERYSSRM